MVNPLRSQGQTMTAALALCLAGFSSACHAQSEDSSEQDTTQEAAKEATQSVNPLDDFSDIEAERLAEEAAEAGEAPPSSDQDADEAPEPELDEETKAIYASMAEVIEALDSEAKRTGNNWELSIGDTFILVVTDPANRRMRVMTPIAPAEALPEEALMRLMQANFDTALDARYAVAQNLLWGTFIHPLDGLTTREFASGILQTKTLADTFGTTFSSGALSFGGGDSGAIIADQLEELLKELEKNRTI